MSSPVQRAKNVSIQQASNVSAGLIGLVLLISLALSFWRLSFVTLWSDEFISVRTISLPWGSIFLGQYVRELHPPFYFLVLKLWITLFGEGELAMRLLSVVFATVSLVVLFLLVRRLGDWRAAAGATLLVAVSPLYVYYATEIRMYSLLVCLSLLAFLCFVLFSDGTRYPNTMLLLLFVCVTLTFYTHYFGVLTAVGIGCFSLVRLVVNRERRQVYVLATLLLCAGMFVPVVRFILLPQMERYTSSFPLTADRLLRPDIILALLSGNGQTRFDLHDMLQILSLLAVGAGAAALAISGRRPQLAAMIGFITISGLIALAINTRGVFVVPRYLLHVNLFAFVLAACSLIRTERPLGNWLNLSGLALIAVMTVAGLNSAVRRDLPFPDWQQVAQTIEQVRTPGEPVVIMGWDANPVQFYLRNVPYMTSYDLEQRLTQARPPATYLIVDSEFARKLAFLDSADVLYTIPDRQVRILRYTPGRR